MDAPLTEVLMELDPYREEREALGGGPGRDSVATDPDDFRQVSSMHSVQAQPLMESLADCTALGNSMNSHSVYSPTSQTINSVTPRSAKRKDSDTELRGAGSSISGQDPPAPLPPPPVNESGRYFRTFSGELGASRKQRAQGEKAIRTAPIPVSLIDAVHAAGKLSYLAADGSLNRDGKAEAVELLQSLMLSLVKFSRDHNIDLEGAVRARQRELEMEQPKPIGLNPEVAAQARRTPTLVEKHEGLNDFRLDNDSFHDPTGAAFGFLRQGSSVAGEMSLHTGQDQDRSRRGSLSTPGYLAPPSPLSHAGEAAGHSVSAQSLFMESRRPSTTGSSVGLRPFGTSSSGFIGTGRQERVTPDVEQPSTASSKQNSGSYSLPYPSSRPQDSTPPTPSARTGGEESHPRPRSGTLPPSSLKFRPDRSGPLTAGQGSDSLTPTADGLENRTSVVLPPAPSAEVARHLQQGVPSRDKEFVRHASQESMDAALRSYRMPFSAEVSNTTSTAASRRSSSNESHGLKWSEPSVLDSQSLTPTHASRSLSASTSQRGFPLTLQVIRPPALVSGASSSDETIPSRSDPNSNTRSPAQNDRGSNIDRGTSNHVPKSSAGKKPKYWGLQLLGILRAERRKLGAPNTA